MSVLSRILRAGEGRKLDYLRAIVPLVSAWEATLESESDDELRGRAAALRQRAHDGEELDDLLPEAFAVVREASRRVTGQRHFDVQVMGGAALHSGFVAEMQTGEGKTLAATLPAFLNSLSGRGVHIVTVNDYLARRDAETMGRIFGFLGMTTGVVVADGSMSLSLKRAQYRCDITYGTNTEIGFDYLRDNMVSSLDDRVHRNFHFAIVDEVDSVLIDEARTPLIIAAEPEARDVPYQLYASIARSLVEETHFETHLDEHSVALTDEGIDAIQTLLGVDNLFSSGLQHVVHGVFSAIRARALFTRDHDYVVLDGQVKIVDEFTGRILEGRKWADGIHQAVEAKEGVEISGESRTLATITLQNFFRMYSKLSGMSGTASTAAAELMETYGLDVVSIPTNRPSIRIDHHDRIFRTGDAKFRAVCDEVVARHRTGQPVLVGTTSVHASEKVSAMLTRLGINHHVLNAKNHAAEAQVIAQAGRLGAVSVATNMAGRGVDILLGGNPFAPSGFSSDDTAVRTVEDWEMEQQSVVELGGLCVIGTERHESERIDRQLRGRAGRQGDPGESVFYVSLEDDVVSRYAGAAIDRVDASERHVDEPISGRWIDKAVRGAQTTVEKKNEIARRVVLDYDEVLNVQRRFVYKRREEIISGINLRAVADDAISDVVYALTAEHLSAGGEWDVDGLIGSLREFWPISVDRDDIASLQSVEQIESRVILDAAGFYDTIERNLGSELMREIEQQMMLQILDRHWREHLLSLESLQDGIALRAAAQTNPLFEWQRESSEMFTRMLRRVSLDFVRYVMHVRLVSDDSPLLTGEPTQ